MRKININKANDIEAIRAARPNNVNFGEKNNVAANEKNTAVSEDKLQISNQAANFGKLVDQIKDLPEVRTEQVNALRDQITKGEYQPSNEDIAEAILKDEG